MNRRLKQHNGKLKGGAKFTQARRPVKLVYTEECSNRSIASKREHEVKSLDRAEKKLLAMSK